MKKYLSLILSFLFLLTMLPISVSAEENTSERDALLAEARNAFPEYADRILDNAPDSNAYMRTAGENEVILSESRILPDGSGMTYTEQSNGLWTVSKFDTSATIIHDDKTVSGSVTHFVVTLKGTCKGSNNVFYSEDMEYAIYWSGYDRINSTGTPYVSGSSKSVTTYLHNSIEAASDPASVAYGFSLVVNGGPYSGTFLFELGSNSPKVTYEVW